MNQLEECSDLRAEAYYSDNDLHARITQDRLKHVTRFVRELGLPVGSRVLDLGCGAGLASARMLELGYCVTGIDSSEKMLEKARDNAKKIGHEDRSEFRIGDFENLGMEEGSFDLVIAMGLIEYLVWDRFALQEMKRVLRPGGHLIVSVPNGNRISSLTDPLQLLSYALKGSKKPAKIVVKGILGARVKKKKRDYSLVQKSFNRRLYLPSVFKAQLMGIGFEIRDEVCHGFGPFRGLGRFASLSLKLDSLLEKRSKKSRFLRSRGSNYVVMAQKPPELENLKEHSVFREIEKGSIPDRSEKNELAALERWMNSCKEYSYNKAEVLSDDFFFKKNILVLSPHPDDELIGCGGTLLKALKQEATLTILQLTNGSGTVALATADENTKKTIRLKEAEVVARALGDAKLVTWNENARLKATDTLVNKMNSLINDIRPDIIFVPFVNDAHPDHVVTSRILAAALKCLESQEKPEILSYEVWGKVPPKNAVVTDDYFYEKERLLMKYVTGMKVVDYISRCLRRDALNSVKYLDRKGLAEVFLVQKAAEFNLMIENN